MLYLEEMGQFFDARLDSYEEHQLNCIDSAREFYPFTAVCLPREKRQAFSPRGAGRGMSWTPIFSPIPQRRSRDRPRARNAGGIGAEIHGPERRRSNSRREPKRERPGVTWTFHSLCRPSRRAHLLTTCKRAAVLPSATVRSPRGARRMRIQLYGEADAPRFFLCRAISKLPFSGFLMRADPDCFHFAGHCSFRETNAQPATATGLFKGLGTLLASW